MYRGNVRELLAVHGNIRVTITGIRASTVVGMIIIHGGIHAASTIQFGHIVIFITGVARPLIMNVDITKRSINQMDGRAIQVIMALAAVQMVLVMIVIMIQETIV